MWVDGFWMGASAVARRIPLAARVAEHGGWERFRELGPAVWREAGVPGRMCALWSEAVATKTRGTALTLLDPRYPSALAALPDAPPVLFVEGDPEILRIRSLAVVGTRSATTYGRQVARDLGYRAAKAGWVVVSGLARGIDGEAHEGALAGGRTVAVLAHGLAHTSPGSHRPLRRRILAKGGAVVSTWDDEEPALRWRFPMRNRWIAGLAVGVVVVEAGARSGALHTVRAAADYGREVFAVPGSITSSSSEGCNRLLGEGATPVGSVGELLEQLGSPEPRRSWVDRVIAGEPLPQVARVEGTTVDRLVEELDMMEAVGELVRLTGSRYARSG